ncbi:protein YkpC [Bacillus swezeyi]|nr:protein YkpC [Bacillus swezeyi]
MLRDLGRRVAITAILSGIILGGMSVSLSNMPSTPPDQAAKINR